MDETRYYVTLDYDDVQSDFMIRELLRLKMIFPDIRFALYVTSPHHYHIQTCTSVRKEFAFTILDESNCSQGYKEYCKRIQCFPVRTTAKKWYKEGKLESIVPPPTRVMVTR
jgi:hypothetical protein